MSAKKETDKDEDDNKFIRLAITEKIPIILSGDGHLLGLKEIQGVKILSATEFLKELM